MHLPADPAPLQLDLGPVGFDLPARWDPDVIVRDLLERIHFDRRSIAGKLLHSQQQAVLSPLSSYDTSAQKRSDYYVEPLVEVDFLADFLTHAQMTKAIAAPAESIHTSIGEGCLRGTSDW